MMQCQTIVPVQRDDALALPASTARKKTRRTGLAALTGRTGAARVLGIGIALLAAFIPMSALQAGAADLYFSGGTQTVIPMLDVTTDDTTLHLDNTAAADVSINTVRLEGGYSFNLNNATGDATIGEVKISPGQSGRLFVADGTKQTINTLYAVNAELTFMLPASLQAGGTAVSTGTADLSGATIGIAYQSSRTKLAVGDQFILLDANIKLNAPGINLTVLTPNGDVYVLTVNGKQIEALLSFLSPATPAYERLKAFAESRAASLALINQGADLLLGQGVGAMLGAAKGPGFTMSAFGAASGGWSKYHTGSHIDVSGFSMLTGLAFGNDAGPGRITLGAFFEGGWGSYHSYNSFGNFASVDGKGNSNYYGGGILARYDVKENALAGAYADAGFRMGWAATDFNTDDIKYNGQRASFATASPYCGLHGGLGYVWNFADKASLDLSAKLIWTRQQGDSLAAHEDRVRFKDADSLRSRLGGRFAYAVNEYVSPYIGAYWEREFDGKTRADVNGERLSSPSLRGDVGMGELGFALKPSLNLPLFIDLGVQGYVGKRQGAAGNLQIRFEF